MNKNLTALILTGALACAMTLPAMAAGNPAVPVISDDPTAEEQLPLPDSVLYYGTIREIGKDEDGSISRLWLESDRYGEYVMNISPDTAWIDSGNHTAFDPAGLKEGERVYVFHSPVSTRSLPPQSEAFVVVRNIPADAGCAQYHEVESVDRKDGTLTITTDNGGLLIRADQKTGVSRCGEKGACTLEDIQAGDKVMAWYDAVAESYPGQTYASHLMLLSASAVPAEETPLTRAELASMLYEKAGKPVVNYAMSYSDVAEDASYAEAVRWAASEGLISGYGDGSFGPNDVVTREQAAVILWRCAGTPMLMDYPGLSQYEDADEISRFAQQAMAWAHQKGLIGQEGKTLEPQAAVTVEEVDPLLQTLSFKKNG